MICFALSFVFSVLPGTDRFSFFPLKKFILLACFKFAYTSFPVLVFFCNECLSILQKSVEFVFSEMELKYIKLNLQRVYGG